MKLSLLLRKILNNKGISLIAKSLILIVLVSCNGDDANVARGNEVNTTNLEGVNINMATFDMSPEEITIVELPQRAISRPETTTGIPHVQIGVEPVAEVNEELIRRVFSIPGIENQTSVVGGSHGMWLTEEIIVFEPNFIGGREFGHIHDDGSLHIFLEPSRSFEAVEKGWATYHPFALEGREGWEGFVLLYTPQTMEELDWTFQLILDGFNYVTGQNLMAADYE
ncbi:DUF5519 family protein [Lutimonas saemankumensis]|uniref:luciferase domain-containing protein n=1 Tax=Lutimonas saemankumensis TaxID=483016 RepID=UPI001CD356B0|nr:luciferase family protein [Lutimonas saemankumensis]MCA0931157.1 DUF5519 family protein [Lutimonas saemankumensis]